MTFFDEFLDLLSDEVTVTPGAEDAYGGFAASGSSFTLPCRIEGSVRMVRDLSGREVVSSVQVIVAANNLTVDGHRYTLPARFTPRLELRAISIEKESDEVGPVVETIMLP